MSVRITWLGHASVMLSDGSSTVYIDPWKTGSGLPKADCILLTHDHYDHYSEADIKALSQSSTRVVSPVSLHQVTDKVRPGDRITVGEVIIEAVPAYNTDKNFHPRSNGWVGYVVGIGGKRIYHSGDTDRIPEMKGLKVDLALVPVGGTFTMTFDQAADAVADIGAAVAIPIHYGDIVGSRKDAEKFKGSAKAEVHILDKGEAYTLA